jgi:hypothetical protein
MKVSLSPFTHPNVPVRLGEIIVDTNASNGGLEGLLVLDGQERVGVHLSGVEMNHCVVLFSFRLKFFKEIICIECHLTSLTKDVSISAISTITASSWIIERCTFF